MAPNPVLIVPKYVTVVQGGFYGSPLDKQRTSHRAGLASSDYGSSCSGSGSEEVIAEPPKGRKRRLDHLTMEEKILRKKKKNREAAQSSRDRKKARMEEMENEINQLKEKAKNLQTECNELRKTNEAILRKNDKLDRERQELQKKCAELEAGQQKNLAPTEQTCANCAVIQNGSAEGNRYDSAGGASQFGARVEVCELPGIFVESPSSLSAFEDVLLADNDELDPWKLEKYAESLLADSPNSLTTKDKATLKRPRPDKLSQPVVGTTAVCVESGRARKPGVVTSNTNKWSAVLPRSNRNRVADSVISLTPNGVDGEQRSQNPIYGQCNAEELSTDVIVNENAAPINNVVEDISCETDQHADHRLSSQLPSDAPVSPSDIRIETGDTEDFLTDGSHIFSSDSFVNDHAYDSEMNSLFSDGPSEDDFIFANSLAMDDLFSIDCI